MPNFVGYSPWSDAANYGQGLGQSLSAAMLQMPQQRAELAMRVQQLQREQAYHQQQMQQMQMYRQQQNTLAQEKLTEQSRFHDSEAGKWQQSFGLQQQQRDEATRHNKEVEANDRNRLSQPRSFAAGSTVYDPRGTSDANQSNDPLLAPPNIHPMFQEPDPGLQPVRQPDFSDSQIQYPGQAQSLTPPQVVSPAPVPTTPQAASPVGNPGLGQGTPFAGGTMYQTPVNPRQFAQRSLTPDAVIADNLKRAQLYAGLLGSTNINRIDPGFVNMISNQVHGVQSPYSGVQPQPQQNGVTHIWNGQQLVPVQQ